MFDVEDSANFLLLAVNDIIEFVFADFGVSHGPPVVLFELMAHRLQLHNTKESFTVWRISNEFPNCRDHSRCYAKGEASIAEPLAADC